MFSTVRHVALILQPSAVQLLQNPMPVALEPQGEFQLIGGQRFIVIRVVEIG